MKTTAAFAALQARHAGERNAKKLFLVKSVTKSGEVSKARFTETDWRFNAFETSDAAAARVIALEALNPGKRFVVIGA